MASSLSIGAFARATFLSAKALRHYHEIGLLEPAEVDPRTGYRTYVAEQITTAQIIRRLRAIDMPLDHIREVLTSTDLETRTRLMHTHLAQLEADLVRTHEAVTFLRELLEPPAPTAAIVHRHIEATPAAVVSATVDVRDALAWVHGAIGEARATLAAQGLASTGVASSAFATELYSEERGDATVFVPCAPSLRPVGRVTCGTLPAVALATIEHRGSHADIDRAYGDLAAHVARHAIGLDLPLREHYLVGPSDTPDPAQWRTEIGWPIFPMRPAGDGNAV
jgi:DNA-binding transcriptional MerR regulator/effector-binding domain-containing protein